LGNTLPTFSKKQEHSPEFPATLPGYLLYSISSTQVKKDFKTVNPAQQLLKVTIGSDSSN
jgi:hypothetical protein